ncbi:MAG: hypothetical protein JKY56_00765 [Kofleriaceae bacterium]|nr:hypothetical protein [Kofleriaceae bacterium]
MNVIAIGIAVGSLLVTMAVVVTYFSKVAQAKIGNEIGGLVLQLALGLALAAVSIVYALQKGALDAAVIAPATLATMFSSMLLYLLSQRKTPVGDLKVKVGDTLLAFEAKTSDGMRFHTSELADRRILLRFFRGGW